MSASAQTHFTSCLYGEGNIFNATLILPLSAAPTVNSMPLAVGSEVAVFSTEPGAQELCVGVLTWKNVNSALAIWGDDPLTPELDGLQSGNPFSFRIWDSSLGFEFMPNAILSTFSNGTPSYDHDETYVLTNLSAFGSFGGIMTVDDDVVIDEDTDVLVDVSANDISGGTEPLRVTQIGRPANGTASIEGYAEIRYSPHVNYYGLDSLSYVIFDGSQNRGEGILRIQIVAVNDAPIISSSPVVEAASGIPYSYLVKAADVDNDALVFILEDAPSWLTMNQQSQGAAEVTVSGLPTDEDGGNHSVSIVVNDGAVAVSQDFDIFVTAIDVDIYVEVPVSLIAPILLFESEAIEVSTSPRLEWEPVSGATRYHLQVGESRGSSFGKLIVDDAEISTSHYQISTLESNTWYEWRVRAINDVDSGPWSSTNSFQTGSEDRLSENEDNTSPFNESKNTKPESFQLYQNYPNPFNPETTITFDVPSSIRVVVDIYDLLGHHIVTLVDDRFSAGRHSVRWSAQDLPSGIYLYRMVAGNVVQSRTLSFIK